jgi:hypothetical protein
VRAQIRGDGGGDERVRRCQRPPYSDEKSCESFVNVDFGWEIAHAAVSRSPPISLDAFVARTHMYTHAAKVWGVFLVQGPFSVAPVPNPNRYDSQLSLTAVHPLRCNTRLRTERLERQPRRDAPVTITPEASSSALLHCMDTAPYAW